MTRDASRWPLLAAILCLSVLAVYATSLTLWMRDLRTGIVFRDESLQEYRQALVGTRDFPYQWRLAGVYLVRVGERLTGADPHAVDVAAKAAMLAIACVVLFQFTRRYTTEIGALATVVIYLLATIVGFSDGYSIYYTSDYIMLAAWFGAVWAIRERRTAAAVVITALGSVAKETMILVPILVGLRAIRGQSAAREVTAVSAAFLIPTALLRWTYPAPISQWAWWHMIFINVPFLQSSARALLETLKNNAKVLLLFNVFWFLAARAIVRSSDGFQKDLGLTSLIYMLLAYPVIVIRELRHFLPLAIVVLPAAIGALEAATRRPVPAET